MKMGNIKKYVGTVSINVGCARQVRTHDYLADLASSHSWNKA